MEKFKHFLLNEEKSYLGHRVGDVLTSMQDLQSDMENLGSRHLTRLAEEIVNQIRKVLHSHWSAKNHKHLKELQKIGVAIQKTIEEKGDLKEILPAAVQALEQLSSKLGVKVTNLEAPEEGGGEPVSPADFQSTGGLPQPAQVAPPSGAFPPEAMPPV